MKNLKSETKWVYWFTLIVAVVVIYKVLDNFTGIGEWIGNLLKVLSPFLMAILLAYLLYIPCRKIEKAYKKTKRLKKKARGLAVATTYLLAILVIVIVVNTIWPILSASIIELAGNLPGYYDSAIKYIENLPEDTKYKKEALTVVNDHLNLLSNRDFRSLCQKLSVKEDTLKEIIALITSLNPRPGNYTVSKRNDFIVPDVVVVKDANGEYTAELNPTSNIIVRINDSYRQLANQARTKEEKSFFKNNLQEANWFIQSLEKRNETLLKVARCIVKHQKAFMEEEVKKLQKRYQKATEIQMHESSISRITTEKYIYTPKGTFELKYFFSSSVSTDDGGAASSTAIKSLIKEYISNENRRKPLSDSKIAQMLNDKGLNVARRTVAKYREALGIASSSQRKQLV